ncbi:hypothetical protein BMF94_1567 [Rhodotorula taiwanensis]|uniref:HSF-type DNA-binding domain-containing protein n=1 Tax=Rhodotorula taiwanensis TaxID=741276 RepID=A0A2S5BEY8_9BASI|nr:hypothetical protein BMF94_1567 [Rhodotorula taiwanensis]
MVFAPYFSAAPADLPTVAPAYLLRSEEPPTSRRHSSLSDYHQRVPIDYDGPPSHDMALSGAVESSRWMSNYAPTPPPTSFPATNFTLALAQTPSTSNSHFSLSPLETLVKTAPHVIGLPSSSEGLTVGQYLTTFPTEPLSPSDSLHSRRDSTDSQNFETESVVDGPIGLTPRVKPFIAKLVHLLSRPETYQDCIVWDSTGESFILSANKRLTGEVFPRLFGHSTLPSFTRQLNVYGFRRLTSSELASRIDVADQTGYSGWEHESFKRGDKSSLHLLNPRPSRARQMKKAQKKEKAVKETQEREKKARATAAAAVQSMQRPAPLSLDFAPGPTPLPQGQPWWGEQQLQMYDISPVMSRDSGIVMSLDSSASAYDSSSSATTATTAASPSTPDHPTDAFPPSYSTSACAGFGSYPVDPWNVAAHG